MKLLPYLFSRLGSLQFFQLLRFTALFITSIIVARTIHDQSIIGQYETLVLIGTSFSFFWVSGIINAFIPAYHASLEVEKEKLIFNIYLMLGALSLSASLLLLLLKPILFDGPGRFYFPYLVFTFFHAPSFLTEYLLLVKGRTRTLLIYGILVTLLQVLAMALPLISQNNLTLAIWGLAVFGGAKFTYLSVLTSKYGRWVIDKNIIVRFSRVAWPLALGLLLGSSMPYVDSYLVKYFFEQKDFAIFQYGARELPFVLLVANALSNVISGDIAERNASNDLASALIRLKKESARLMHVMFPMTVAMLFASRFLYARLYSPAFLPSSFIFNIYLLLTISRLVFPQTILVGMQQNKVTFRISSIEWVTNLVLNLVLLYFFGMVGIAWATVFAYFLDKALQIGYLRKRSIPLSSYVPVRLWVGYSLLLGLAFLVNLLIS